MRDGQGFTFRSIAVAPQYQPERLRPVRIGHVCLQRHGNQFGTKARAAAHVPAIAVKTQKQQAFLLSGMLCSYSYERNAAVD